MSGGEDFGKPCSAILPEVLRHGDSGLPFWEEDEEEQEEQGGGEAAGGGTVLHKLL